MILNQKLITTLPIPYKGGIDSTWNFFARDDEFREHVCKYLVQHGCNAIVCLLNNTNLEDRVSIFRGTYGSKVDYQKLELVVEWARRITEAGGYFVPCLFCDDDYSIKDSYYEHVRYISILGTVLEKYVAGWIVWLEGYEVISTATLRTFVGYMKANVTDKPIGSHGVYKKEYDPGNLDFWVNEFPWHPHDGVNHSTAEALDIAQKIIEESKLPIWFLEDCWDPETATARERARALLKLPGTIGVGAPIDGK